MDKKNAKFSSSCNYRPIAFEWRLPDIAKAKQFWMAIRKYSMCELVCQLLQTKYEYIHSSVFLEKSQIQERRTSDYFVNADFVEEYSQMSVSHTDAFQSKTNNKGESFATSERLQVFGKYWFQIQEDHLRATSTNKLEMSKLV